MWDFLWKVAIIVGIIAGVITINKAIKVYDFTRIKSLLSILGDNIKRITNHPLYNKIGIGLNALQLLFGSIYALLGSLSLVLKGHSINYAMIPFILMMAVSINLFYQSTKLYQ